METTKILSMLAVSSTVAFIGGCWFNRITMRKAIGTNQSRINIVVEMLEWINATIDEDREDFGEKYKEKMAFFEIAMNEI